MKWTLLLTSVIITITSNAQSSTNFNEDLSWDQIKTKSKNENKIIFIDLYATWCGPCKKMDNEVYTNPTVSQYLNKNFVSIKLQADSSKLDGENIKKRYNISKQILKKFKIHSFPSYLFIDADENILHRGMGYMAPDPFIAFCRTAQNVNQNYAGQLILFHSGKMTSDELLNFAITLRNYQDDSLAQNVAKSFKEKAIDNRPPKEVLTPKFAPFFDNFGHLITSSDNISRYIYLHQKDANQNMKDSSFSARLISRSAIREFITPSLKKSDQEKKTPDWSSIRKKITKAWDKDLASDLVLRYQISWSEEHQEWADAIQYHMQRLDKLDNTFSVWQAVEINNFVFLTVLKHSNDTNILKKAKEYMKSIVTTYPDDFEKMDTYANVLYKLGKKEEAIQTEKRALAIAETKKDKESSAIIKKTISKMEANIPTWNED